MKLYNLLVITIAVITSTASAQIKAVKTDTLFFEDFNKKTLDRSRWNLEVIGYTVNNEQQAYVDSTATMSLVNKEDAESANNGALVIKAIYNPGFITKEHHQHDFLSGRINTRTKFEFTYGTVSARMKMTSGAGLWPAFWALGEGK